MTHNRSRICSARNRTINTSENLELWDCCACKRQDKDTGISEVTLEVIGRAKEDDTGNYFSK